jgi:hypothetical protein
LEEYMFKLIGNKKAIKDQEELISLRHKNEELYSQYKKLESRIKEVEDAYTIKSGVVVRNEITQVHCKFSKIDMIIMMSGIYSLMKSSSNVHDITSYTELIGRMQNYIDEMQDDQ